MNFFNKIGNKIKLVLFNPDIPSSFSPEEKAKEQMAHKETERRRQQVEYEHVMKETEKGVKLTPEEIERAQKKAKEREETKPWGM